MEKQPTVIDGFFKEFCETIRKKIDNEQFKNFCNLSNDEARFQFVHNLSFIKDELNEIRNNKNNNLKTEVYEKNVNKSNELKNLGNKDFQLGKWTSALNYYNLSYLYTPEECLKEIAIILANRSASLYHMKKYDLVLKDIERAIGFGYPKNILYKVKERRARCYLAKKLYKDALSAFKDALPAIDDSQLSLEKRAKFERDVQVMIKILTRNIEIENENLKKSKTKQTGNSDENENVSEENEILNSSIKIDFSEHEGRFAKATSDIRVGEIIVSEKPHVSVLLETYAQSNCLNCFKRCLAPIMCTKCTKAIFCSELCQSISTHHRYECALLSTLWCSGASITCHMALRIITQKPERYFLDLKPELDTLKNELTDKLKNNDYRKIYNLVRHENQRNFEDFFQRTIMAFFLTTILSEQNYFEVNKNIIFIGTLMLRNLQILQFNAHEVAELQQNNNKDTGSSEFIGAALYPTLSLFNHSCDPGIVRYYKGNSVVARAVKNIKKDEVVAENYGPIFTQVPKEERKATLKNQYWFDCECQSCLDNWPLFKNMDDALMRFRCENSKNCKNIIVIPVETNEFMFKCTECGEHTNIFKGLKAVQDTDLIFRTANRYLESGENGKALLKYIEMLNILDENLAPPFKDFHLCQQGIRRCMLEFGNRIIFN